MGALFGTLTSLSIGASDFFARTVVNRRGAIIATLVMQAVGTVASFVILLFLGGEAIAADIFVGFVSGTGMGIGIWGYLSGLRTSSSAIVSPIVATMSAVIPFAYAIARGADASGWAITGAVVAISGLVLVSRGGGPIGNVGAGIRWSVFSGFGYGFGLSIIIEASSDSGMWPALSQRLGALLLAAVVVWATHTDLGLLGIRFHGVAAGIFAALSTVFYLVGVQADAAPAVVTASMFPAVTVLVGRFVFHDVVTRLQALGLVIVLAGVSAVVAL